MSELSTYLIEDGRISNISDKMIYGVQAGPAQSTYQPYTANSTSSSNIIWNVQCPSENVVIDRHLLMQSTITLTLVLTGPDNSANNILVFDYGLTDSLAPFPLNNLCTTQSCTINSTSISQNTRDILPQIMQMYDKRKLNKYNSICPSLPDSYYLYYKDGIGANNNVLSAYNNSNLDNDFVPRGSFNIQILEVLHSYTDAAGVDQTNSNLINLLNTTKNVWKIVIQFTTTEPFLALSPWTNNANVNSNAGLVGVNNISFNLSIGDCSRVFSTANDYIKSITLGGTIINPANPAQNITISPFQNTNLLFNFLSLQPEQYNKISAKNVLNFLDFPRYISTNSSLSTIAGIVKDGTTGELTISSKDIVSPNLQLSQIPDLILIAVRKPINTMTYTDSASFLTINKISVNFNNSSGILASMCQQQLYLLSVKNGSGQSYYQFCGTSKSNYTGTVTETGNITYQQALVGRGVNVSTTGSLLVISPTDLNLSSYLAPGSIGQYNLSFTINVSNQYTDAVAPELVIICVNSGFLITQNGMSALEMGVLTKELTLKTKEQKSPIDFQDLKRFIGGSLSNMGMSNVNKLFKKKHINDDEKTDDPIINHASGLSAGSMNSGRIKRLSKHIK